MTARGPNGGVGCLGVVAIVLITLRLAGVIAWSWWWVLAPLWGSALAWIAVIVAWFFVAGTPRSER